MNVMEHNERDRSSLPASRVAEGLAEGVAEVADTLAKIVSDGLDIHRCVAARTLGRMHADNKSDILIKALLDEDEDVRADAAGALSRLCMPSSEQQLLENLLGDPSRDVKLAAIEALTALKSEAVQPWLKRIAAERDEEIAWDDADYYDSGWDDWTDVQVKAIEALGRLGVEDAVPGIVAAINDENGQDLDEVGFKALSGMGAPGLAALLDFLNDANERRRRRAARALAWSDGPTADEGVMQAMRDPAVAVRLATGEALSKRNPDDERLLFVLLDKSPEVRAQAVKLCGSHHPDRLPLLLEDSIVSVRVAVMQLLTQQPDLMVPDAATLMQLRDMLAGDSDALAVAAAEALAALAPTKSEQDLLPLIGDENRSPVLRQAVARGLSRIGGAEAAQALANVLGGDERQLRLVAMSALSTMAAGEAAWPNTYGDLLLRALAGELVVKPEAEEPPEETSEDADQDDQDAADTDAKDEDAQMDGAETADASADRTQLDADDSAEPELSPSPEDTAENAVTMEPSREEETPSSFPTSTLEVILSGDGKAQQAYDTAVEEVTQVELDSDDLEFLSLAQHTKKGKKRLSLTPDIAPHEDVRMFAARLLGDHPHLDVGDALIDALDSDDKSLVLAAADSLHRVAEAGAPLSDKVVAGELDALKHPELDLRLLAVRTLGAGGAAAITDDVEKALIKLLKSEESFLRTEAIRAIDRLGLDKVRPAIVKRLGDSDPSVRLAAAQAIARSGDAGGIDSLGAFALSFEGYHGREAGRLMRDLEPVAANRYFLDVLADEELRRYWIVAIEALEQINAASDTATDTMAA